MSGEPKWAGWGEPGKRTPLGDGALALLRSELGEGVQATPVELAEVRMPEPQPLPEAIAAAVGDESVLTGHEQRVRRSAGRSYPDLVRLRGGARGRAPGRRPR
ncbi:MAG: FAD-binding oxidoreductase, partial [Solirubrobacterales bacterium]